MGVTVKPGKRHCKDIFYGSRYKNRFVAWIYQENTKNACAGTIAGPAKIEQIESGIMSTKNIGSNFDDFLAAEGLLQEATATAVKRYIAFRLQQKMADDKLSKTEMAKRMATSRSALDRLLDPDNTSVTLQTLQSAANAIGGRLKVELDFR